MLLLAKQSERKSNFIAIALQFHFSNLYVSLGVRTTHVFLYVTKQ